MAIIITEDCINCGACEPECPNNAIYEGGADWKFSDGTKLDDNAIHEAVSLDYYYIVSDKCTECVGFHEEPQCAAVCPVDCCVPDPDIVESKEDLLKKKAALHLN